MMTEESKSVNGFGALSHLASSDPSEQEEAWQREVARKKEEVFTMKFERKFFRCLVCGNIIAKIFDAGVNVHCCGQEMAELVANTTDAAQEKHVPVGTRAGSELTVTVGSVPHPMTEAHHIAWICVAQEHRTERVTLEPTGEPTATFTIDGEATIYEYCNLHGLWAADV
jgi:superoxide reductase